LLRGGKNPLSTMCRVAALGPSAAPRLRRRRSGEPAGGLTSADDQPNLVMGDGVYDDWRGCKTLTRSAGSLVSFPQPGQSVLLIEGSAGMGSNASGQDPQTCQRRRRAGGQYSRAADKTAETARARRPAWSSREGSGFPLSSRGWADLETVPAALAVGSPVLR
jgi:hypothetical protein